jgi:1-acyl-sn-glycerol-3-phosphate acyltransferase
MDMFLNGLGLRPVIRWVAADANFRTLFMKFVMVLLAGAIAKAKNRSDMVTLSRMKLLTGLGCVLGVYQEGERSWDGVNLPPVKGTDKLVRFLKIPVVYAHHQGAYLDHPRWSWSGNRTAITVRYELLIGPDEIDSLSLSEISERISRAGAYDEWAQQKKALHVLKGNKRAEHCELVCFLCPGCLSVNTLTSAGNDFSCSHCGLGGSIDPMGSFAWPRPPREWPGGRAFENIREWSLWQTRYYEDRLDGIYGNGGDRPADPGSVLLWEDRDTVALSRGRRGRTLAALGVGSARLFGDRIEFESPREHLVMPLKSITGFSVFMQHYTEFYYDRLLYRFTFTNRSVSGYKWLMLFRLISSRYGNGIS